MFLDHPFSLLKEYFSNSFWIVVWENALGSVVGVGVSLYLYRRSIKRDLKIKEAEKSENENDILRYFAFSLNESFNLLSFHIEHLQDYIERSKIDYTQLKAPIEVSLHSIKRLIESPLHNELMIVYLKKFKNDDNQLTFFHIFNQLDYLYSQLSTLPINIRKLNEERLKDKLEYDQKFQNLWDRVSQFLFKNMPTSNVITKALYDLTQNYLVKHNANINENSASLKQSCNDFIEPILTLAISPEMQIYEHLNDPDLQEIIVLARDSKATISKIQFETKDLVENLVYNTLLSIIDSLDLLRAFTINLFELYHTE